MGALTATEGRDERVWRCSCGCRTFVGISWIRWTDGDMVAGLDVSGQAVRPRWGWWREWVKQMWQAARGCRYFTGPDVLLTPQTAREMADALTKVADMMETRDG